MNVFVPKRNVRVSGDAMLFSIKEADFFSYAAEEKIDMIIFPMMMVMMAIRIISSSGHTNQ